MEAFILKFWGQLIAGTMCLLTIGGLLQQAKTDRAKVKELEGRMADLETDITEIKEQQSAMKGKFDAVTTQLETLTGIAEKTSTQMTSMARDLNQLIGQQKGK